MDNKKLEYQVFTDLKEGDKVSLNFKKDYAWVRGSVVTRAKIEQDPIDGQYYTVGVEIGNHFLKIDSREVEEFWKSSCHGWQEDNNILGKDYLDEDFGINSNVGDKEFIRQVLEKWNTYSLGQQYYLSDLITASINGETFKMIIDSALDEINKAIANAGTNTNTYFTQLNQLLSQAGALQNLASILQNSTSKIQSVSSGINTGLNGNIPFNTNEWSEATAAASQYLDKLGQIVNVEKNYRELNGKQALSYKVLGSNGNSVTVDQKGNLITAHQKTNISTQKTYFSSLANRISNYDSSALKSQKQDYKDLVETLHTILSEAQKISQVDLLSEDQVDRFIELKNQATETETKLKNVGKGTSVNSAEKLISKIYNFMGDNGKAVAVFGDELDEIINKIKTLGSEADLSSLETQFLAITNQSKQMDLTGNKFFQNVKDKISSGLEQSFAQFFSIYDVVNYGKQIVSVATDVNSAFTDLSKVSDATVSDLESKLSDYAKLAKDVGSTITDTISATSDWSRMGYNIPESQELAKVSLIYKNVGDGIDIEEANNSLISTLKGFNLEADDAMSIIDKFNKVSNNFAIDSGGIGEALQRSAASFNAANTDLSKSIALITGTNTTLQDPDKVGEYILPTFAVMQ